MNTGEKEFLREPEPSSKRSIEYISQHWDISLPFDGFIDNYYRHNKYELPPYEPTDVKDVYNVLTKYTKHVNYKTQNVFNSIHIKVQWGKWNSDAKHHLRLAIVSTFARDYIQFLKLCRQRQEADCEAYIEDYIDKYNRKVW